ncbi:hypothetical protein XBO1_2310003 [Xenorhabdus bovienii str. oregonense]|uniref:Uncharacterized protein n=1 Tax=Xenorhabdus bovienii str. oregonense TaxID=1398202 RepID=A0A077P6L8_XENBV|nr:hypothetical protein XBO1_2310003 [Xenorhabdus bovienii str. oregonense]
MHAMQALSQLSYSPTNVVQVLNSKYRLSFFITKKDKYLVELSGIEPLTSCMPCKRSPS